MFNLVLIFAMTSLFDKSIKLNANVIKGLMVIFIRGKISLLSILLMVLEENPIL